MQVSPSDVTGTEMFEESRQVHQFEIRQCKSTKKGVVTIITLELLG